LFLHFGGSWEFVVRSTTVAKLTAFDKVFVSIRCTAKYEIERPEQTRELLHLFLRPKILDRIIERSIFEMATLRISVFGVESMFEIVFAVRYRHSIRGGKSSSLSSLGSTPPPSARL
jgi:hypothetical protein